MIRSGATVWSGRSLPTGCVISDQRSAGEWMQICAEKLAAIRLYLTAKDFSISLIRSTFGPERAA
jgi:hypothetical protein